MPPQTPANAVRATAEQLSSDGARLEAADRLLEALAPSVQALGRTIADAAAITAAAQAGQDVSAAPPGTRTIAAAFAERPELARELLTDWRGVAAQLGAARSATTGAERLELAVIAGERASDLAGRLLELDPNAGGTWLDSLRGGLRDAAAFLGRVAEGAADAASDFGAAVGTGAGLTLLVGAGALLWLLKK